MLVTQASTSPKLRSSRSAGAPFALHAGHTFARRAHAPPQILDVAIVAWTNPVELQPDGTIWVPGSAPSTPLVLQSPSARIRNRFPARFELWIRGYSRCAFPGRSLVWNRVSVKSTTRPIDYRGIRQMHWKTGWVKLPQLAAEASRSAASIVASNSCCSGGFDKTVNALASRACCSR